MKGTSNVIRLKTAYIPEALTQRWEDQMSGEPGKCFPKEIIIKSWSVLEAMEEEWEMNHGSVQLRDRFHLLRHYIQCLRRYHEGN